MLHCNSSFRNPALLRGHPRSQDSPSAMSQQLQISSLVSAFALVCLCLFARAGVDSDVQVASGDGPIVQVLSVAAAKG